MANKNKFEEMLERLINEDKQGAEELFHDIVVEKSRKIYENLLESDYEDEEDEKEKEVDEADHDDEDDDEDDDKMSEDFDLDEFEVAEEEPEDPMTAMGGDETDDLENDIDMDNGNDEMSMDDEGEEELEDRVVDLEDALDELKAEFEDMMSDENGGEDSEADMDDMDNGEEEDGEEGDMDDMEEPEGDDEEKEAFDPTDQVATMREYVEKVTAKMGDDGANKQSTVAGENDMGGTAENIARDDTAEGGEAGSAGGAMKGSSLSDTSPKDMSTGNVNVPGGKASKSMKKQPKGHGAEKEGSGESSTDAHSTIGSK